MPRLIPRSRSDLQEIRRRGLRAWLTWATFEQAMGEEPLTRSQRFFRRLL